MSEPAQALSDAPLPTTPEGLYAYLRGLGIGFTVYEHPPVFTVAESAPLKASIPGCHCRNLFVRDKKEAMYLVVAANETQIDLKKLSALLDCGRLSFGSADRLWRHLGVRPGSVCPFAIINDKDDLVTVILDKTMMESGLVNYHPLENDKTIVLTSRDLVKFIESCGHTPRIVDLSPAAPDNAEAR